MYIIADDVQQIIICEEVPGGGDQKEHKCKCTRFTTGRSHSTGICS